MKPLRFPRKSLESAKLRAQIAIDKIEESYAESLRASVILPFCLRYGLRFHGGMGTWAFVHDATGAAVDLDCPENGWPVAAWPSTVPDDADHYAPDGWEAAAAFVFDVLSDESLSNGGSQDIGSLCHNVP